MSETEIDYTKFCEIKISYTPNIRSIRVKDRIRVSQSDIAFEFLKKQWADLFYVESFATILLDRKNGIIGLHWVSKGGLAGTVADPKIIFQAALKAHSCSIILAHNHPSGNKKPSTNDISLTKKLKSAGTALDLQVLDHIILADGEYYSFADEGIM